MIVSFRDTIPKSFRSQVEPYFNGMILNSIATAKQSAGKIELADYVKSKLPGQVKTTATPDFPKQDLQKFAGNYELNSTAIKVAVKDDKTLIVSITGNPDMELTPIGKAKFAVKFMDGYTVDFTSNDKDEVTELVLNTPGGQQKAPRKK